ncbi:MAG TPA: AmmeMemoRadiSam system protein B [Myxococcota bacterium]|nr:AmmeMemoRadiSam system protein B [Myxococcota bacterium]HSA23993.1 AmmeMemoRadiSam system protein B [Myxococcota bacterium]
MLSPLFVAASCERGAATQDPGPVAPVAAPAAEPVGEPFPAQVAGQFYPARPEALRAMIAGHLAEADKTAGVKVPAGADILGVVVPHAGYPYSGPVAAHAFAALRGRELRRVVVLGPAHRRRFPVPALLDAPAYQTPLGPIPIDRDGVRALAASGTAQVAPDRFLEEHALEVELPFLQVALGDFQLVPVMVSEPDRPAMQRLAAAIQAAFPGRDTLVVASTDLSHDYPYEVAVAMDALAMRLVTALDADGLVAGDGRFRRAGEAIRVGQDGAPEPAACQLCGLGPVLALVELARLHPGAAGVLLDRRTSGDVVGDTRSRIVGYGAVAIQLASPRPAPTGVKAQGPGTTGDFLSAEEKAALLGVARQALERHFATGSVDLPVPASEKLRAPGAAFVTLKKHGELRGCIGHMEPTSPLWEMIRDRALDAALNDNRFPQVTRAELAELRIEISVLSPRVPVKSPEADIVIGRDGVWLELGPHRGVFLPQVPVEQGWDTVPVYLDNLCRKAHVPERGCWRRPEAVLQRFSALVFGEEEATGPR